MALKTLLYKAEREVLWDTGTVQVDLYFGDFQAEPLYETMHVQGKTCDDVEQGYEIIF